ncbi:cytochrome P450 86B1-like [Hibiscus syriacus]|uniref:cytochrome P450 86B1-like n=1 Tax=Hibiscus syriacus TaxID=106335 RepID=UPI001920ABBC|nr:cytochrome P450 86B1-like [Hibiscus syriacus]
MKNGNESKTLLIFKPEEIKKMDYLQAALSEALRLYPSVPVDHKEAVEDDVFPDGTVLKKGTNVVYAIYAMGRMETIWGKDCRMKFTAASTIYRYHMKVVEDHPIAPKLALTMYMKHGLKVNLIKRHETELLS